MCKHLIHHDDVKIISIKRQTSDIEVELDGLQTKPCRNNRIPLRCGFIDACHVVPHVYQWKRKHEREGPYFKHPLARFNQLPHIVEIEGQALAVYRKIVAK